MCALTHKHSKKLILFEPKSIDIRTTVNEVHRKLCVCVFFKESNIIYFNETAKIGSFLI